MTARLFVLLVLTLCVPATAALSTAIPQNDAGSGHDAPDTPSSDIIISPGVPVTGMIVARYERNVPGPGHIEDIDTYAFHAQAGDVATTSAIGFGTCARVVDQEGNTVAGDPYFNGAPICGLDEFGIALQHAVVGHETVVIPASGPYFLEVRTSRLADSTPYQVQVDLTHA